MTNILVAGAGKSSTWLIKYLLEHSRKGKWTVTVADGSAEAIKEKVGEHPNGICVAFDITNTTERQKLVQGADIVVSLMPPHLHILLAKDCLQYKKNLITSSYISPEMKELDGAVREAGLMFMCEMGLDPGIDHMTANQIIHSIQRVAGRLESFKSYCGGLIAPESDTNPWHYKFSWNPRNIIDAGKAGATYLENGKEEWIDYAGMFRDNKVITVDGVGELAWYANRDSLKYLDVYEVPDAHTFLRATLRHPDFCTGWDAIARLGLTDMEHKLAALPPSSYAAWMKGVTGYENTVSLREHVANKLTLPANDKVLDMMDWLGLFSEVLLPLSKGSNGEILLKILEEKWAMEPQDKDMVVMQHEVAYQHKGRDYTLVSSMVIKGENRELSAMAKTVGLPMAILASCVVTKRMPAPVGVHLPGMPSVYKPLLKELAKHDIVFNDRVQ